MPDGTPQVTPIWFDYTHGKIRINSKKGRVKTRNMQEGAPVALSILDPDNPYRYIQIRGRVGRSEGVTHVTVNSAFERNYHLRIASRSLLAHLTAPEWCRDAIADLL
jgi:hypothetical protein